MWTQQITSKNTLNNVSRIHPHSHTRRLLKKVFVVARYKNLQLNNEKTEKRCVNGINHTLNNLITPTCLRGKRSLRNHGTSLRSEEHTSELQSHSDLVCRLLLEKKKIQNT